jgi:drug/metabolite transporter (DMT)-like permease
MAGSNIKNASPLLVIVAFAIIYIVWGSTYFFILVALKGFPPMMLGALRFIIAGALMLVWCFIRGEKLFILNDIKHAAVSSLLMLFAGTGMVIWVEQYLPSAFVAILVSADPIWFVLMDKPKWKENFTNKSTITGLIFGFIGVILLFKEKINSAFSGSSNYIELGAMFLIVIGSLCWTGGSLYSKYRNTSGSNTVNAAWQLTVAGIAFMPLSFLLGEQQRLQWQSVSADAWFALFYLIVFGSIAAYTAYVWLLQVRSATQVSTFAYVNPVIAVLLGVFFASENISFLQITGLAVILVSVMLVNLAKYRK